MKDIQKYIVLIIILFIAGRLFCLFRDIYLTYSYGGTEIPWFVKTQWNDASQLFLAATNIASALWLYHLASKYQLNRFVWSVFGFLFGLIPVVIFYLARINEQLKT